MRNHDSKRPSPDDSDQLRQAIEQLTDAIRLLTQSVDELSTELQWRNNQDAERHVAPAPLVMTSMPLDPLADDWQINRHSAADLPADEPPLASAAQRALLR